MHYIPVSFNNTGSDDECSNAPEMVRWAENSSQTVQQIVYEANQFSMHYLSPEAMVCYTVELLLNYHKSAEFSDKTFHELKTFLAGAGHEVKEYKPIYSPAILNFGTRFGSSWNGSFSCCPASPTMFMLLLLGMAIFSTTVIICGCVCLRLRHHPKSSHGYAYVAIDVPMERVD